MQIDYEIEFCTLSGDMGVVLVHHPKVRASILVNKILEPQEHELKRRRLIKTAITRYERIENWAKLGKLSIHVKLEEVTAEIKLLKPVDQYSAMRPQREWNKVRKPYRIIE